MHSLICACFQKDFGQSIAFQCGFLGFEWKNVKTREQIQLSFSCVHTSSAVSAPESEGIAQQISKNKGSQLNKTLLGVSLLWQYLWGQTESLKDSISFSCLRVLHILLIKIVLSNDQHNHVVNYHLRQNSVLCGHEKKSSICQINMTWAHVMRTSLNQH